MKKIEAFNGPYRFLSNFYGKGPSISVGGLVFQTVEAAYQSQKSTDRYVQKQFTRLTAAEAKMKGRSISLRKDWDDVKVGIMYGLLAKKFKHNRMKKKLIDTAPAVLIEGNWWGDKFWGVCYGEGRNVLGKLLMQLRDEFIGEMKEGNVG